ncbi:MAG TPA: NAD(P)/FAD-dependent oxidoreductase [Hungateiclostridium thermocellum]|jgi:NAD(P)H-nitrite reductase large subunit|uniref:FAD-dependent pyridine nucleotide-disulfide oxidoreductase n=2 Tax=Acetivibrio thermocellus TaxID=1515 RepID=A3DBW2_ACET2|nr:FAD-dependent oxidoreductase [Acetivibrio thermocellus]CDG34879.1 FAD-dependent pyridine nucleotide-disulfide oxidoreductase [Acetivibrio thermocellus BC1]ABN51441.1 FAD-dependent pyridine nucleotide-disulfide oxidoreductase [Acetivibrio thermocellus ATCC 27405]ADU75076.1 FAD-dependent pyridine nucleotide-disulfide oxidoreductase [Acetivibrio thermocellus DSM 1313]ALX09051.1 Ferredoxin--NAD(+) reductase [Acetivibrio thermocellus AD2]ANV76802.1 Ferredoxin--NAD(+) reductase [Acetivibrio therm
MKYVIIGNSIAAVGAVEGIRKIDTEGEITIIGKEPYHVYSRPLISYLLYGKTDEERMKYRGSSFYDTMNCKVILGREAVKINDAKKEVVLDNGEVINYDKLLVATGSLPFVPPMKGLEGVEKRFSFLSLDDAKKLESAISPSSKVLIIGAGLIGLKCAEGISKKVESITVVDLADRILSSILDKDGAEIVKSHIEKENIKFVLNAKVEEFINSNEALLDSGEKVEFDVLVVAVGVIPNTGLIKDINGKVNRGIVVDEFCQTSIPDIYAAGDCCESFDITSEQNRVLALLPNAYMQGECAGINMAGGKKEFGKAIPMNAISFFGLHIITAGSYVGEVFSKINGDNYKKLFVKDGLLKGYIMIGDVDKAGIYTSLIREKTPLSEIDFELIFERPGLMAFTRKERQRMLGGVVR